MREGAYYRFAKAELSSLPSSSEEEDAPQDVLPTSKMLGGYQRSEAGDSRRLSEASLSTERHAMKETLYHVRNTLNTLAPTASPGPTVLARGPSVAGATAGSAYMVPEAATHASTAARPAGVESLLSDIASRLGSIESMYGEMSTRLARVDNRVGVNERSMRELQHISAGAIGETARLVDLVGGRTSGGPALGAQSAAGMATPPGRTSLVSGAGALAAGGAAQTSPMFSGQPAQTTPQQPGGLAVVQAQIHKLVAGLDWLENHIIRQDSVLEGLQRQVAAVSQEQATRPLNEVSVKVHDLGELVTKLRSHMYKLEKKNGNSEATGQLLTSRINELTARVLALEQGSTQGGRSSSVNPLFFDQRLGKDGSMSPEETRRAGGHAREFSNVEDSFVRVAQLAELLNSQDELRGMVHSFGRELQQLQQHTHEVSGAHAGEASAAREQELAEVKSQLAQLTQSLPAVRSEAANASRHAMDLEQRLVELRCGQDETRDASGRLQMELGAMRRQLAAVVDNVEERLEQLSQAATHAQSLSRSLSVSAGQEAAAEAPESDTPTLPSLHEAVQALTAQVSEVVAGAAVAARDTAKEMVTKALEQQQSASDSVNDAVAAAIAQLEALRVELQSVSARAADNSALIANTASRAQVAELAASIEQLGTQVAAASSALEQLQAHAAPVASLDVLKAQQTAALDALHAQQAGTAATLEQLQSQMVPAAAVEELRASMLTCAVLEELRAELAPAAELEQLQARVTSTAAALEQLQGQAAPAAALHAVQQHVAALATTLEDVQSQMVPAAAFDDLRAQAATTASLGALQMHMDEMGASILARMAVDQAVDKSVMNELAQELEASKSSLAQLAGNVAEVKASLAPMVNQPLASAAGLEAISQGLQELGESVKGQLAEAAAAEAAAKESLLAVAAGVEQDQAALNEQVALLRDQLSYAVKQEQLADALTDATTTLRGEVSDQLTSLSSEVAQLVERSGQWAPMAELVGQLRSELIDLTMAQQGAKASLETVSDQVVELAGRLDAKASYEELQAVQTALSDVKEFTQQGTQQLTSDVEQMQNQAAATSTSLEQLQQTIAELTAELEGTKGAVSEQASRMGDLATHMQVAQVVATVEEMQSELKREYINHDKLSAIFAAREDMRSALDKLERVFTSGRLTKEASLEMQQSLEAVGDTLVRAGIATPRIGAAVEELNSRVSEMQQQITMLMSRRRTSVAGEAAGQSGLPPLPPSANHQLQRKASVDASAPQADSASSAEHEAAEKAPGPSAAVSEELLARVQALEDQLSAVSAAEVEMLTDDIPTVKASVQDLQLMVFELRSELNNSKAEAERFKLLLEQGYQAGPAFSLTRGSYNFASGSYIPAHGIAIPGARGSDDGFIPPPGPAALRQSSTYYSSTVDLRSQPEREDEAEGADQAKQSRRETAEVKAVIAAVQPPSDSGALDAVSQRVESLEASLMSKVMALESHVYSLSTAAAPGTEQQAALAQLPEAVAANQQEIVALRNAVDEVEASMVTLRGQLDTLRLATSADAPLASNSSFIATPMRTLAVAATAASAHVESAWSQALAPEEFEAVKASVAKLEGDVAVLSQQLEGLALPTTRASEGLARLDELQAKLDAFAARTNAMAAEQQAQHSAIHAAAASATEALALVAAHMSAPLATPSPTPVAGDTPAALTTAPSLQPDASPAQEPGTVVMEVCLRGDVEDGSEREEEDVVYLPLNIYVGSGSVDGTAALEAAPDAPCASEDLPADAATASSGDELVAFREQLQALQAAVVDLTEQLAQQQQTLAAATASADAADALAAVQQEVEEAKAAVAGLTEQLAQQQQDVTALAAAAGTASAVTAVQQEMDNVKTTVADLVEQLARQQQVVDAVQEEVAEVQETVADLTVRHQQTVAAVTAGADAATAVTAVQQEVEQVKTTVAGLVEQLVQQQQAVTAVAAGADAAGAVAAVQEEVNELRTAVAELQAQQQQVAADATAKASLEVVQQVQQDVQQLQFDVVELRAQQQQVADAQGQALAAEATPAAVDAVPVEVADTVRAVQLEVQALQSALSELQTAQTRQQEQQQALLEQAVHEASLRAAEAAAAAATAAVEDAQQQDEQLGAVGSPPPSSYAGAGSGEAVTPSRIPVGSSSAAASLQGLFASAAGAEGGVAAASPARGASVSGQALFLQRLLEVVKRQSRRLRTQYSNAGMQPDDAEAVVEAEVQGQLEQVDNTLQAVERQLQSAPAAETQSAYAEAMVTILEQVATLRTIGSQTHPAIQQMILNHDSQLQVLQQQVSGMVSGTAGLTSTASALAAVDEVKHRLSRLEAAYTTLKDSNAALNKAMETLTSTSVHQEGEEGTVGDAAMKALAAKLSLLEERLLAQAEQAPEEAGQALVPAPAADPQALAVVENKLTEYGKVLQAMRNRIVALQEYIDSTQGMVKELHTVHGSVLMRLGTLEAAAQHQQEMTGDEPVRHLQADLLSLETKFQMFEVNNSELSTALQGLQQVTARVGELDAKDAEMGAKLAAIGATMPVITGQLKQLERRLHSKMDLCCNQLDALGTALQDICRLEKPDTKNPFAAIAAATNNPAIKLLENKVESLRTAMAKVVRTVADDFRTERQARVSDS